MGFNTPLLTLHVAVVLLGATGLFGKFLDVSPLTIIAGRSVCTAVFTLAVAILMKRSVSLGSSRNASVLCVSGLVLSVHWFAFFHAIQLSTVAIGVIGFATYPIFVTLLEPLFFRERYRLMDLLSGALACLGIVVLSPRFSMENNITQALLWAVLSGLLLAFHTLLNRKLVLRNHFLSITFYQHATAAAVTLPFIWVYEFWPSPDEMWILLLLGLVFTAIPQALLVRSLKHIKAQVASVAVGLEPLYAIIFALVLLGEIPQKMTVLGGLIIAVAVAVAMLSHSRGKHAAISPVAARRATGVPDDKP